GRHQAAMTAKRVAEGGPRRDALRARVDGARAVARVAGEPGEETPAHGAHPALLALLHHDEQVLPRTEIPAWPEICLGGRGGAELGCQRLGRAGAHDATPQFPPVSRISRGAPG